MKRALFGFTSVIGAVAMMWVVAGCTTTTTTSNGAAAVSSQKEMLLTQAGFRARTVTTATQKQRVEQLSVGVVSAVKYQGKLYYVYPTAAKDHILVGKQPQFDSYKKMLAAHVATVQQTRVNQSSDVNTPTLMQETAGPNRVSVEQFDGFTALWDTGMSPNN